MIAGLELPTSGEIYIDGVEVSQRPASQRDIAFVFQMFALYPHMNVRKNISYPLVSQGMPRAEVRKKVEEVATILGIQALLDRPVGGLSGGDRQRVALGRAIVRNPACFLMDEPLGALDAEFREHMAEELRALHDRMRATTVYVTHDQMEAMAMADKIAVMNHGVIEQFATPQETYARPASVYVADFIGSPPMNFIGFRGSTRIGAEAVRLGGIEVPVPRIGEERAEGDLILGVRPEHVRLSDTGAIRGRVFGVEYLGTTQIVTIDTDHGPLKARVSADRRVAAGDAVGLSLNTPRLSLFDAATGRALLTALHGGGTDG